MRGGGHDFLAEDFAFEDAAGDTGEALAVSAAGDRLAFRRCRFVGWQGTLYANGGGQYYARCAIEGRVDFIFGGATAVLDPCTIRSKDGGYATAASTPEGRPSGFVYLDPTLTGDGARAFLGRPWRPYAAVAFVRCRPDAHVRPAGWDNGRDPETEKTARYSDHRCTGPGADRSGRVAWPRELGDDDVSSYTRAASSPAPTAGTRRGDIRWKLVGGDRGGSCWVRCQRGVSDRWRSLFLGRALKNRNCANGGHPVFRMRIPGRMCSRLTHREELPHEDHRLFPPRSGRVQQPGVRGCGEAEHRLHPGR